MKVILNYRRLPHGRDLDLPAYAESGASGLDLRAASFHDCGGVPGPMRALVNIAPGQIVRALTGICVEIPNGFEGQIRPRSGLAMKHGLTVLNSPGTIDASYRGEIAVLLINHGAQSITLNRGDRIAQLVIAPVARVFLAEIAELSATERSVNGFGSTGIA